MQLRTIIAVYCDNALQHTDTWHSSENWNRWKTESQLKPKGLNLRQKKFLTDLLTKFYGHWIDENIYSSLTYVLFNPLNTKRRLLYLRNQFVPRSKHFSSRL